MGEWERHNVVGLGVDATSYHDASARVIEWAKAGKASYVVAANVYTVMQAHDFPDYSRDIRSADLVTPDGMPLVWALRLRGARNSSRVYGPTLMLHVCATAEQEGLPIGLYGGRPEGLTRLAEELQSRFPRLQIVCRIAPPFRALTPEEDEEFTKTIQKSGARILFVGIGSPRQEMWMARHVDSLPLVALGVGAAFDFIPGLVRQAPPWLQAAGLEWLFRLMMEPRRLWRRYLIANPRFVGLALMQMLGLKKFDGD